MIARVRSARPATTGPASIPAREARIPSDLVFATGVLSLNSLFAVFYWARYVHYGKPLVLLDYEVGPLAASTWGHLGTRLLDMIQERNCRNPKPVLFLESDMLAAQAREAAGVPARAIPTYLVATDAWPSLCQSAAARMKAEDVGLTRQASERMDRRPFLNEAGVVAGPRTDDPTVPAYLYGVVLGLDPVAAKDPSPKPIARAPRN